MPEQYEIHSPTTKRSVGAELQRLEEECARASRVQFVASARWTRFHYRLGVPAVVLSVLAALAFGGGWPLLAAAFAIATALLAALLTFMKPIARACDHRNAANQYLALQNDARVFREIRLFHACNDQAAIQAAEDFAKRCNELTKAGPPTRTSDDETAPAPGDEASAEQGVFPALRRAVRRLSGK